MNKQKKLVDYLDSNYHIRTNSITRCVELSPKNYHEPVFVPLTDKALKKICFESAMETDITFSERMVKDCITSVLSVEFNPLHLYFDRLRERYKKEINHGIIELLSNTIITETEGFNETLTKWMVSSVDNIFNRKGCQNDRCLVLNGNSGIGKSTWIDFICPNDLSEYKKVLNFFPVPNPSKDYLMYLNNSFIIEMDGVTQSEQSYPKYASYVRQGEFDMRMPFETEFERFQRNANFICSTNSEFYYAHGFKDSYYFPTVNVQKIDFDLLHTIDIDRAWYEAFEISLQPF